MMATENLFLASDEPVCGRFAKRFGDLDLETVLSGQGDDQALARELPDVAIVFLKSMNQIALGEESGQGEKDVDVWQREKRVVVCGRRRRVEHVRPGRPRGQNTPAE
jgi:hypothetical protein